MRPGFRVIALLAAAAWCCAANAALVITMRIDPQRTLPSLPVSFAFLVTNTDSKPVVISNNVALEVAPAEGARFYATWDRGYTSTGFAGEDNRLTIDGGATRELYIPFDETLAEPAFFGDPRLSLPGRYLLRAHLYELNPDGTTTKTASNDVALEIGAPEGEDAAAYSFLAASDSRGWSFSCWLDRGSSIASELVARYPRSGYFPFAVLISGATSTERLELLDRALGLRPSGLIADYLMLEKGALLAHRSNYATSAGYLDAAMEDARAARRVLEDVATSTSYPFVRADGERLLKEVREPQDIPRLFRWLGERATPAPEPLTPFVECVNRSGTALVARFGYTNANSAGKYLDVGKANRFEPGKDDQGQPRYFAPGRISGATSASSVNGRPITWYLDGNRATATTDAPPCSIESAQPVRPVVECVRHENESVVATFGYDNPNRFAVVIPIGDSNHVDGVAVGQPEIFFSGRHKKVVKVNVKESAVRWTIGGKFAIATPRDSPQCVD